MRFMYIVKHPGPSTQPPPEMMEAMHKLADREIKVKLPLDEADAATADNWSATTESRAEEVPAAEPADAALDENAPATLEPAAVAPSEAPSRSAQRATPRWAPARKN